MYVRSKIKEFCKNPLQCNGIMVKLCRSDLVKQNHGQIHLEFFSLDKKDEAEQKTAQSKEGMAASWLHQEIK